ncbi:Lrp/AsnC family transcriptional regulator [Arenibaculum pallidiluteum]|uniref:Lrp/AsnC family transcriptional regulator n=1 Tax=Arenibaculum pallidiluteum TaxID=2812559 RepID=UPI001A968D50|nr:Lrp/AsnC family transcriptional regulator [Arenibaculum pallidiluteum]
MHSETDDVRLDPPRAGRVDAVDRKLLGLLLEDATLSYAELGRLVHLSAPAVHERVKKLRRAGAIRRTTVELDGTLLGRPLLSFVEVETSGWGKTPDMLALRADPRVEEMHSVTGEACVLLKVRCTDTRDLEDLLHRIYAIEGVKGTRSTVALQTFLERGPQP